MKSHNRINTSPSSTRQPLISVAIDLGNRKQDKIAIFRDTDPHAEATKFVARNHMNTNMVQVIYNSIIKQMKAYDEMMLTYETQKESDYLGNIKQLKKNQLEQQQSLKRLSPNLQPIQKQHSKSKSKSPVLSQSPSQQFEDLPTDRVVLKRLFQILDQDQDGLISQKKIDLTRIPLKLKNYLLGNLNSIYVPIEYEEFYEMFRNSTSQEEYFGLLKSISELLSIPRIKVLL